MLMVGYIDKVAEYGIDWTYVHDAKNMKQVIGISWGLNAMMFQKAKMSFSGFQEYFIITDIIYLYLLLLQLFTFFLFLYFVL